MLKSLKVWWEESKRKGLYPEGSWCVCVVWMLKSFFIVLAEHIGQKAYKCLHSKPGNIGCMLERHHYLYYFGGAEATPGSAPTKWPPHAWTPRWEWTARPAPSSGRSRCSAGPARDAPVANQWGFSVHYNGNPPPLSSTGKTHHQKGGSNLSMTRKEDQKGNWVNLFCVCFWLFNWFW